MLASRPQAPQERPALWLRMFLSGGQSLLIACVLFVATMGVEVPWIEAAFADDGPIQVEGEVAEPVPLVVEAEAAQFFLNSEQRRWVRAEAFGRSAISLPGTTQVPEPDASKARLDYDLFFPKAGAYYVWLRGLSHTPPQAIGIGLDGELLELGSGIALDNSGVWQWQNGVDEGRAFVIVGSPGHHRLNLYAPHNAEIHLDRILLSDNAAYTPSSVGPVGNNGRSDWAKVNALEPATSIVLEAEHYIDRIDRESAYAWQLLSRDNTVTELSGANGVQTQMREGAVQVDDLGALDIKQKTELSYTFDAPHKGKYFLWIRGKVTGDGTEERPLSGVHLGLNDKLIYKNFVLGFENQWQWKNTLKRGEKTKAALINIRKAGPQTLHLWGSDSEVSIDKILLTDDADLLPLGFGPEESAVQSLTPDHTLALEAECSRNWDENIAQADQVTQAYFKPNGWLNPLPANASEGYSIGLLPPALAQAQDTPRTATDFWPDATSLNADNTESAPSTATQEPITLAYDIDIGEAGDYTLWLRAYDTGLGDSAPIHVTLEGQTEKEAQTIAAPRIGQWQWVKAKGLVEGQNPVWRFDNAAPYRLLVEIASPHVLLDKLILSPDADFVPLGAGPVSPQGGCQEQRIFIQNDSLGVEKSALKEKNNTDTDRDIEETEGESPLEEAGDLTEPESLSEESTPSQAQAPIEPDHNMLLAAQAAEEKLLLPVQNGPQAVGQINFSSQIANLSLSNTAPRRYEPGTIKGDFQVDNLGAANYAIPLELPPGIGGWKPDLSFTYNSQAGVGLLGYRWSLSGLTSITRCRKNYALDGLTSSINFNSQDAYCVNGQRLVHAGTGYRTAVDDGNLYKIVRYQNGLPSLWHAYTKDGDILEFSALKKVYARTRATASNN